LKLPVALPEKERLPAVEVIVETVVAPDLNVIVFPLVVIESTASVPKLVTVTFARLLEQLCVVGQLFEQVIGSG
jgi:hypothetical protein